MLGREAQTLGFKGLLLWASQRALMEPPPQQNPSWESGQMRESCEERKVGRFEACDFPAFMSFTKSVWPQLYFSVTTATSLPPGKSGWCPQASYLPQVLGGPSCWTLPGDGGLRPPGQRAGAKPLLCAKYRVR